MAKKSRSRKARFPRVSLKQPNLVLREVDYIVARAAQFDSRVVTLGQLAFFSTASGDAWMLDPADGLALKLAEKGNRNPPRLSKRPTASPLNGRRRTASTATSS